MSGQPMLKDLVDQIRALQQAVELADGGDEAQLRQSMQTAAPLVERLFRLVDGPVLGAIEGPDAALFFALAQLRQPKRGDGFEQLADDVRAAICGWFRAVTENDPRAQQRAELRLQSGLDAIYALGRSGGGR